MKLNLAAWCIKHKQVVYFFMALITITGIYSFNALGRSEDPKFVIRQMVISCAWPGATADEMEQHVTSKIEKTIQSLPDLDYITSYSRPGTCVVNVIIKEQVKNKDVRTHWLEARNYIHDHLSDLPSDVYGPYFNDRFDDVYGNIYALTSDSFTYEDMRVEAEELKRQFYTVKDVRKVDLVGVSFTGHPLTVLTVSRNNQVLLSLPATGASFLNLSGQDMVSDISNNSSNIVVTITGGVGQCWLRLRKVGGYETIEPIIYNLVKPLPVNDSNSIADNISKIGVKQLDDGIGNIDFITNSYLGYNYFEGIIEDSVTKALRISFNDAVNYVDYSYVEDPTYLLNTIFEDNINYKQLRKPITDNNTTTDTLALNLFDVSFITTNYIGHDYFEPTLLYSVTI